MVELAYAVYSSCSEHVQRKRKRPLKAIRYLVFAVYVSEHHYVAMGISLLVTQTQRCVATVGASLRRGTCPASGFGRVSGLPVDPQLPVHSKVALLQVRPAMWASGKGVLSDEPTRKRLESLCPGLREVQHVN